MYGLSENLEPYVDFLDQIKGQRIEERMQEVCADILKKGSDTSFQEIYDSIYELAEEDIDNQRAESMHGLF